MMALRATSASAGSTSSQPFWFSIFAFMVAPHSTSRSSA
jgi:hypothetical protein